MANYSRKLRMEVDLRRKGKIEKTIKFAERIRKVQEKTEAALAKVQEEMKRQADKGRKKAEEWKEGDKIMLSIKNLVFKKRPVKKQVNQYVGPYVIDKIVFTNTIKLQLPMLMRIYLVVNISWVV